MPRLSIIIPIYNTAAWIPACIESIINQSFSDFEILLIDDGSTDGSGVICDMYTKTDSRIRVFHKKNGGVSSARNYGLDKATGEWIYFVDSDDELLPDCLRIMTGYIRDDIDIVLAGYEKYDEQGNLLYSIPDRVVTVLQKKESLYTLYETHAKYYNRLPYLWIRLLRRSVIEKEQLRFDESICNKEDTLFLTQYICRSNGISLFTTTPVYHYNQRPDSIMGSWRHNLNQSFVSSFYALKKMKHEISALYSPFSEIVYIAKEGIWNRYHRIMEKYKSFGLSDPKLFSELNRELKKEGIGIPFIIRNKLRRAKRKFVSIVNRSRER